MSKPFLVGMFALFISFSYAQTNTFPTSGNVGIGTTSPAAKLSFNNLNDGSDGADGITWYNPSRFDYGIYRTSGSWVSPDYQQLKLSFVTGIILNPGTAYGKSYVDVQGGGLRVSSGNVAIGSASAPAYRLDVTAPANDWKARFQGPDGYITIGPMNSGFAHIYTDRPYFIFNKNIWSYNGGFSTYNTADMFLQTNGTTRMTISNSTGHVGINTTSPSARLNVLQTSGSWTEGVRLTLNNKTWDMVADSNGDRLIIAPGQDISKGLVIKDGNIGIGTPSPNQKLTVYGTIYGKEVRVDLSVPAPDYVFENNYALPSLDEVRRFINEHKHLPDVPSATQMEKDGIEVGTMNMLLLKKIEELTLYVLELQTKVEKQDEQIQALQNK